MLVLSRHRDQSIMIGDDVVVTIVDIRGDKVRLGINAPTDIPVHRREVYEAIKRENEKAARIQAEDTKEVNGGGGSASNTHERMDYGALIRMIDSGSHELALDPTSQLWEISPVAGKRTKQRMVGIHNSFKESVQACT